MLILRVVPLVLCVLLFSAGCSDSSTEASTRANAEPKAAQVKEPPDLPSFTNDNAGDLAASPGDYERAEADIVGKVFTSPEHTDGMLALQVFTNEDYTDQSVIIYATDDVDIAEGDFVRAEGEVGEELEGENGFGAALTIPTVLATSLRKVSPMEAAPKALRSITRPHSAGQHGVKLLVKRVDFAASETRMVISVTNRSGSTFSIYSSSAKAVQGSRQVDASFNDTYGDLPSEVLPGSTVFGVIVFPPLRPSASTRLVVEGSNENYDLTWSPFDVKVS